MAIKVMAPALARDPEFLERFRREGAAAARLRHPNIVGVFDFVTRDGLSYIAMEYLGARTLKDLISDEGQQSPARACQIMDELLSALASAHAKGIVHRDIKPANIMITDEGSVALTDFSVAHMKDASKLTQTGAVVGTPEYMAPEQFDGVWDQRTDLYAAGIIFYELLTGFSPFRSATMTEVMRKQLLTVPDPPSEVDYTIPESLSTVVSRALEKKPEARYQSAQEMRAEILAALEDCSDAISGTSTSLALEARVQAELETPTLKGEPLEVSALSLVAAPSPVNDPDVTPSGEAPPSPPEPLRTKTASQAPPLADSESGLPVNEPSAVRAAEDRSVPPALSFPPNFGLGVVVLVAVGCIVMGIKGNSPNPPSPAGPSSPKASPSPAWAASTPARPSLAFAATPVVEEPLVDPLHDDVVGNPAVLGYIIPGVGVGEVELGQSKAQVEAFWGAPQARESQDGHDYWSYSDGVVVNIQSSQDKVVAISVGNPAFRVEDDDGPAVGQSRQEVKSFLGPPTDGDEETLYYGDDGLIFRFQAGKCAYILVVDPDSDMLNFRSGH